MEELRSWVYHGVDTDLVGPGMELEEEYTNLLTKEYDELELPGEAWEGITSKYVPLAFLKEIDLTSAPFFFFNFPQILSYTNVDELFEEWRTYNIFRRVAEFIYSRVHQHISKKEYMIMTRNATFLNYLPQEEWKLLDLMLDPEIPREAKLEISLLFGNYYLYLALFEMEADIEDFYQTPRVGQIARAFYRFWSENAKQPRGRMDVYNLAWILKHEPKSYDYYLREGEQSKDAVILELIYHSMNPLVTRPLIPATMGEDFFIQRLLRDYVPPLSIVAYCKEHRIRKMSELADKHIHELYTKKIDVGFLIPHLSPEFRDYDRDMKLIHKYPRLFAVHMSEYLGPEDGYLDFAVSTVAGEDDCEYILIPIAPNFGLTNVRANYLSNDEELPLELITYYPHNKGKKPNNSSFESILELRITPQELEELYLTYDVDWDDVTDLLFMWKKKLRRPPQRSYRLPDLEEAFKKDYFADFLEAGRWANFYSKASIDNNKDLLREMLNRHVAFTFQEARDMIKDPHLMQSINISPVFALFDRPETAGEKRWYRFYELSQLLGTKEGTEPTMDALEVMLKRINVDRIFVYSPQGDYQITKNAIITPMTYEQFVDELRSSENVQTYIILKWRN